MSKPKHDYLAPSVGLLEARAEAGFGLSIGIGSYEYYELIMNGDDKDDYGIYY